MSKKEEFLKDLEDLCSKYDSDTHGAEIYLEFDGDEQVISVYLPATQDYSYVDFILPSRPYDGRRE